MSELDRQNPREPNLIQQGGDKPGGEPAGVDYDDPEIDLPGDDDYIQPSADIGDSYRGQGTDRVGGYGNRAIPQEPGPSQDH